MWVLTALDPANAAVYNTMCVLKWRRRRIECSGDNCRCSDLFEHEHFVFRLRCHPKGFMDILNPLLQLPAEYLKLSHNHFFFVAPDCHRTVPYWAHITRGNCTNHGTEFTHLDI
jgi:hypothetical protein